MKSRFNRLLSLLLTFVMLMACAIPTLAEPTLLSTSYTGSEVKFVKEDGSNFGMWAPQAGTTAYKVDNDANVEIHYVPKNSSTYTALYWGLLTDTPYTKQVVMADGALDFTVSAQWCGKLVSVVPLKDDLTPTSTQYYLAIPAADKLSAAASAGPAETFGFTLQVGQYTEGADFHTASLTDVVYALTDAQSNVYTPSSATAGMLTYSDLDASKTYTFTATREGWTVCKQGEWNTAAHAYDYIYLDQDAISVTITSADADKNITDSTNPGMVFRVKPPESNAVTEALALVPADLSIFTDDTASVVTGAVNAADPAETDADTLQQMAAAVVSAVKGLVPKDGSYSVDFELSGNGMFKIIDSVALDVNNGAMTYRFVNGSKTYIKLYIGTIDEANAAAENDLILPGDEATTSTGKAGYNWTVPISALETEIPIAAYSKSKSTFNSTGNFLLKANSLVDLAPVELAITNNTGMFKAVTASLETNGGATELVVALSGTGYHYLFKGTYEEAVANGDDTTKWIAGATNTDGKWEFRVPVAADESYIPVVAISQSYYEKYLNSQNTLARAFYPRQMTLDREAKTLVTGDYENVTALTVTNNVSMFKVNSAALETVGGPNSNGYKSNLILTMGSTSYDQAFIGSADAAATAAETIALGDGNVFTLPVKWVKTFGQPETLTSLLDAPFVVSFRSASKQTWYERQFTVSEADGTLLIKPAPVELEITNNTGMFKAVTASLETNGGATELVFALSGTGYHYLFKGTYEEAVANGDDTSKWIAGATNTDGKWEFRVPVAADESYIPVVAISQSYYEKYLNSQNTLARAFYPRQMTLDRDAKTLVTGDYENETALTVTNNATGFTVSSAALETVGGPNSNGYAVSLNLGVGSGYDKAFLGAKADITAQSALIDVNEGAVALKLKWIVTAGDPDTIQNLMAEPFTVCFRSGETWTEYQFTVSEADATLAVADVGSTGGGGSGTGGEGGSTGGDTVPRELSYSGDIVTAITADGDRFGMFEPQSGTAAKRSGSNVVIHFVPKNKTVYNGLHLGLITDTLTKDVVFNADGSFDLTLSIDKCGKMIAIAPIKAKDGGTTAGQYYLAIPAADKFPSDDAGTGSDTGSTEVSGTTPTGTPETTTEITTVTNADGSVTETKAETTVTLGEDGGKTSVTTTTVTVTDTDGNAVTTVTVETAVEQPDGSSCAYVADAEGAILSAEVAFSEEAVSAAQDEPITLPVALPAAQDAGAAAELTISLPETLGSVAVAIPVTDVTVNSVIVLVHEDGTEEVLPEVAMTEAGLVLELEGSVTVKVVDNEQSFKDMPEAAWSNDAIHFMAARGLMNGVGHDAFAPDAAMDRSMIVTVLYRLARQPAIAAPASFDDVLQGMWYSDAVAWAEAAGIVTGYGSSFGLRDPVTREQVAVMLWRLAGMPEAEAVDCGAHDWGAAAMSWAIRNGLIEGDESGYNTTGTATRAEVSAIVMRYINLI